MKPVAPVTKYCIVFLRMTNFGPTSILAEAPVQTGQQKPALTRGAD
jgi:hypothetical protein